MIQGIGTDIVSLEFIANTLSQNGDAFLRTIFSEAEIRLYHGRKRHAVSFLGGRFAAKEAFLKAIGTGIECELDWPQIEFLNQLSGKPYLTLSPSIEQYLKRSSCVHVSISHHEMYATAFVVIETRTLIKRSMSCEIV